MPLSRCSLLKEKFAWRAQGGGRLFIIFELRCQNPHSLHLNIMPPAKMNTHLGQGSYVPFLSLLAPDMVLGT